VTTKAEYDRMLADAMPTPKPVDTAVTLAQLDALLDVDKEKERLQAALRESKAKAAQLLKERGIAITEAKLLREEVAKLKVKPPRVVQINDPCVAAAEKRAAEAERQTWQARNTAKQEKSRADAAEARIAEVQAQATDDIEHANRHAESAQTAVKGALDRVEKDAAKIAELEQAVRIAKINEHKASLALMDYAERVTRAREADEKMRGLR
jgi:chromosome segregation ATPase